MIAARQHKAPIKKEDNSPVALLQLERRALTNNDNSKQQQTTTRRVSERSLLQPAPSHGTASGYDMMRTKTSEAICNNLQSPAHTIQSILCRLPRKRSVYNSHGERSEAACQALPESNNSPGRETPPAKAGLTILDMGEQQSLELTAREHFGRTLLSHQQTPNNADKNSHRKLNHP